jgi:hypothetical protein
LIKGFEQMGRKEKKMSMLIPEQLLRQFLAKGLSAIECSKESGSSSDGDSDEDSEVEEKQMQVKRATMFFNIGQAHRFSML